MVRKLATYVLLLLVPLTSFADLQSPMKFTGQNAETVKLEKVIKVTRPVPREVPSTCTRKVPYEVNRCHDVTRYRQECVKVPADQECNTEYDHQCHSVTRYRQECTQGPSRQECSTTPTRQVCTDRPTHRVCTQIPSHEECSTSPSRQVCTSRPSHRECTPNPSHEECSTTPSREVCTDRPSHQVCTTRPDGQQHCTTVGGDRHCTTVGGDRQCRTVGGGESCRDVGGGQDCRTVGGERECHQVGGGEHCTDVGGGQDCRTVGGENVCRTVEGDPICRQVAYSDQECEDVPRQACHTVPAHNECNQVPYSESVCGPETEYRDESYACTETVYDDKEIEKKVSAILNVTIKTNGFVEEFGALISLVPDAKGSAFAPVMKLTSEPKILVVVKTKSAKIRAEGEQEIKVEGDIEVELIQPVAEQVEFPAVESASLEKKTSLLSVVFAKGLPAEAGVVRKGDLDFLMTLKGKELAKLQSSYPGAKVELKKIEKRDVIVLNLAGLIQGSLGGGLFGSSPQMKLQLKIPSKIEGEILNLKKPQTEKLYEKIKVKKI